MSKIMPIPSQFKDILDNLVDSLNDGSNTNALVEAKQIYTLTNDILGHEKREKYLNGEKDFLKNRLQEYQQCHDILSSSFGIQYKVREKLKGEEINRDKKDCYKEKRKAIV